MKTTFLAFSAPSKNLILNKKIYSASHSEFRKSQGVKIFAQNYYKASKSECNPINVPDSVTKNWKRVRISKEVCIQKKTLFNYVATWKRPILHFLCLFKRRGINLVILGCVTFWNKELQRARFWIRKFKLPRIRNSKTHKNIRFYAWKILQGVKFELKPLIHFRFWKRNFKTCHQLKNFALKKPRFELSQSVKTTFFAFSVPVLKAWLWIRNFTVRHIRNSEDHKESDFLLKKIYRVSDREKTLHSKNHVLS